MADVEWQLYTHWQTSLCSLCFLKCVHETKWCRKRRIIIKKITSWISSIVSTFLKALAFLKALTNDLWFLVQRHTSCPINYENMLETLPPIPHILIFPFSISPFSAAVISSACFISHAALPLIWCFGLIKKCRQLQTFTSHFQERLSGTRTSAFICMSRGGEYNNTNRWFLYWALLCFPAESSGD